MSATGRTTACPSRLPRAPRTTAPVPRHLRAPRAVRPGLPRRSRGSLSSGGPGGVARTERAAVTGGGGVSPRSLPRLPLAVGHPEDARDQVPVDRADHAVLHGDE